MTTRLRHFWPCLAALLTLGLPLLAHAATLNVPSTSYPTIQSGVDAAHDGDTVLVADGTYIGPGNRDIDFHGKSLTVTSQNGPTKTIIDCGGSNSTDGSGNHRGFYLHSNEINAVISGFTVKNGYETEHYIQDDITYYIGRGGGVYIRKDSSIVQKSNVAIQNCVLTNNVADDGGGVAILDSSYSKQRSDTVALIGCTLSTNTAKLDPVSRSGGNGGGVEIRNFANSHSSFSLINCIINSNIAAFGGGLDSANEGGTTTLTGCLVSSNTASLSGGGIGSDNESILGIANGGTTALDKCTINGNKATYGGGLISFNDNGGVTTVVNCVISANAADQNYGGAEGQGGGIYNENNYFGGRGGQGGGNTAIGTTVVTNCTLSANTAPSGSSSIYNDPFTYDNMGPGGTITVINSVIRDGSKIGVVDSLVTYSDVQGGYAGTGNIDADPLFVNAATSDLHLQPGSPCLGKGTPTGAPGTDKDGRTRPTPPSMGAYELTSTVEVSPRYPTIQAAVTVARSGDTVLVPAGTYAGPGNVDYDFGGKDITVKSVDGAAATIIDCGGFPSADGSGNHRAFYLHSGETNAVIEGFTIKNGYEAQVAGVPDSGYGGGICIDGSSATIRKCIFSGSTATQGGGGIAIIGKRHHTITLTNCVFTKNTASTGGGTYTRNDGGNVTLIGCTLTDNTAQNGGGSYNQNSGDSGTISEIGCLIAHNTGDGASNENDGDGDAITLLNCSVSGNASPFGSAILNFNSTAKDTITLVNDIVYADRDGAVVDKALTASATLVTYSDIQGGHLGTGNIDADPLFVSSATGDLHLKPGSPCLGAGTPDGAAATDLDGNPRPNPPSMGAYELAAPAFALNVTSARMISSHKLAVTTERVFGTTSYTVTVRLGLKDANGNPLALSQDLTSYSGLPNSDQSPFIFDLKQLNVPRFTKNQRFSVTAEVTKDSSGYVRDTKDMIIWLPVVLVPGINGAADLIQGKNVDHPYGGDGTFPNMEAYLKQSSQNYLYDNKCLGESYYLYQDPAVSPHDYPTLFTLPYDRDNASFAEGADKLSGFISLSLSFTYAAKVEIATHSKGGLVARAYLEYQDDTANHTAMPPASAALVNRLIMTVPPNTGSLWPKLDVIGFGYIDFSNLYPTWPYLRQFPFQKYIYPGKPNQQLTAVNADDMYLPKTVSYTIVYTDKYPTPETITVNPLLLKRVPPYIGLTVGDSVVPFYSQEGFLYSPNDAAGPSVMIHPFRDILINHVDIPGFHTSVPGIQSVSYLELPDVENEVFTEIKTDF